MRQSLIILACFLLPLSLLPQAASAGDSFSISASKTRAIPGQYLTIKGRVPSKSAKKLELIRTLYGGVLATGTSDGRGYYSFRTRMPSMPKEGFAVRVVGGPTSKKVSVTSVRQSVSLTGSPSSLEAQVVPAMKRTVRLERRTGPSSWTLVSTKSTGPKGLVGFRAKPGPTYRAYAVAKNDIVPTYSLPLYTSSVKLDQKRTSDSPPRRVYSPQPDSHNGAAAKYGWYPAASTWDWIYGEGMGDWTNYSTGTGASLLTYGGLWSISGPEGDRASFGTLSSTYRRAGAERGQWEVRGRAVQRGTPYSPYRIRYSLVPAGSKDGARPQKEIILADFKGYGSSFSVGYRDGSDTRMKRVKGWPHNGVNWHLYAVQVGPDHLTFLVNGKPVGTVKKPQSLSASWVFRAQMIGSVKNRMTSSTLGTDWVRHFPLAKRVSGSTDGFR